MATDQQTTDVSAENGVASGKETLTVTDNRTGKTYELPVTAGTVRAMGYGTVLASFNVEEFGTERVSRLQREEIDERFEALRQMTQFESVPARRD